MRRVSTSRVGRNRERGSAMLVTLVLITTLLAGGVVLVGLQLKSSRSTELTRNNVSGTYCAEAGLAAARAAVAANYDQWNPALASGQQPDWLSNTAFSHDLDGDGADDFVIVLRDNDDEVPPAPNDPTRDIDLKIFIVSTCIMHPGHPKRVLELIEYKPALNCYESQEGGCNGRGNANVAPAP
jgi:hypothetical protein